MHPEIRIVRIIETLGRNLTPVRLCRTILRMRIRSVRHKGLKRFIEKNDPRGLSAAQVERIRNIVTALIVAESLKDLHGLPGWRLHPLTGERRGQWSLSVTGNWRITFRLDDEDIHDLNLEDYH